MPGVAQLPGLPPSWEELGGVAYCLSCQRKLAGDAKAATLPDEGSSADRVRANSEGRIEFELGRDPDRCDTRIARSSRTSVILVRQVRERLGVYPTRPV
jgi:hypothetical protein